MVWRQTAVRKLQIIDDKPAQSTYRNSDVSAARFRRDLSPETKLIYISHLQGIDVRRQLGGGFACQISWERLVGYWPR